MHKFSEGERVVFNPRRGAWDVGTVQSRRSAPPYLDGSRPEYRTPVRWDVVGSVTWAENRNLTLAKHSAPSEDAKP